MKNLILIGAVTIGFMSACHSKKETPAASARGVYVRTDINQKGRTDDTLIVVPLNDDTYFITRKTCFSGFKNCRFTSEQHKVQQFISDHALLPHLINDFKGWDTFGTDGENLLINEAAYQKIN